MGTWSPPRERDTATRCPITGAASRSTLAISLAVLIAEVVGGLQANSLALLADAGHLLSDVAGLLMAVTAAVLMRRPPTDKRTWGFRRAEVLAAAAQAAILLAVGVFVLWIAVSG